MQTDASGAPQSAHFAKILEAQSNELCKLRRLLDEHQQRERTCQRKWNALLKENIQLQQKLTADGQQLSRQRDQF